MILVKQGVINSNQSVQDHRGSNRTAPSRTANLYSISTNHNEGMPSQNNHIYQHKKYTLMTEG